MRMLFLTDNFPPEVNAPATRTFEHCKEWVESGVEVTVITCCPNFPTGKAFSGYKNRRTVEYIDGIKVIRVWTYMTSNSGFLKRIIDYMSFSWSSFWTGLFIKTDVIIATSPQLFTAVSGSMLSWFKRKPWVMEVRDLWPESIKAVSVMEENRAFKILQWLERKLYRSADKIVVVTDAFKTYIDQKIGTNNKISVVKNGANLAHLYHRPKDEALLDQLQLKDKYVIGYIGTHGLAHALDFVVTTAHKVTDPRIHFLFVGEGAAREQVQELAKKLQVSNVTFIGMVPKIEVVRYISIIDVSLVNLKKSDTFKTVIPSKIFESAALRKPMLLGVEGEACELIQKYQAGLCFEPENEAQLLKCIEQVSQSYTLQDELALGCDALVKDFNRKKLAQDMLSFVRQN